MIEFIGQNPFETNMNGARAGGWGGIGLGHDDHQSGRGGTRNDQNSIALRAFFASGMDLSRKMSAVLDGRWETDQ
jgi:hypothetical protein